ncbi:MAG: V-type ATP synthase subunit D [Spirochaetales bacterium]|nr:V-type ATP synthase subunit D [Spirochaetales bacterium]
MAKIKLSKNELKRQKDSLQRLLRYLPTLVLKKRQLQAERRRVELLLEEKETALRQRVEALSSWVGVFGDDFDLRTLLKIRAVYGGSVNVAGIDLPVFEGMDFEDVRYDLFLTPLWVDRAIEFVRVIASIDAEIAVLKRQLEIVAAELLATSQRINLFEKVKIPEARNNIRIIQIHLGDLQIAAVVRGKISKNKLTERAAAVAGEERP